MLYSPQFIILAAANLFVVSSQGAFFLFPLFVIGHGGSKLDIGITMAAFTLAAVLCRPWVSDMIDKVGRKRSYSLGSLIASLAPLMYLFFHGNLNHFYAPLIAVRLAHGVGFAICFTAAFTYIVDIIPKTRLNEGAGVFGLTALVGMAVGPVFAETIILHFGFSIFFLSTAGLAATGLLLHLPLPESYESVSRGSSPSFFSVLFQRRMITVTMLALLFGFGISASSGFVSPFVAERSLAYISVYYISYSAAAVFTRLFGGRFADRVGEERIIPFAIILAGSGLLCLIFLGGNSVLILSGLLSGCGHGFLFPCLNAMTVRSQPVDIRGKLTGIFTGGIDAGVFIGSILLGYIGELAGFKILFAAAGVSLLTGFVIFKLRTAYD